MLLLYLLRGIFVLIVACIAFLYAEQIPAFAQHRPAVIVLGVVGAGLIIVVDMIWPRKSLRALAGVLFGLLAGMVVTYVFSLVVTFLASVFEGAGPERPELVHYIKSAEEKLQEEDPNVIAARELLAKADGLSREEAKELMNEVAEALRLSGNNVTRAMELVEEAKTAGPEKAAELRKEAGRLLGQHDPNVRQARSWLLAALNQPESSDFMLQFIKFMVGAVTCYLTISFVMQTKDDFRFVVPYVEFSRQTKGARPFLLDTSVIIDGRIAEVCQTGVIESEVVIPRFVLQELQTIADSRDGLKRKRGRRGLDVLNAMQADKSIDLVIRDLGLPEDTEGGKVDELLVEAAERTGGRVVTNDYNLNKIARLRGVDVVNLNDLANALKPVFLPGEGMKLRIVKPGEGPSQGVGYLEDGTMVVVEQARGLINQTADVVVTSSLQTSAGRLIFGKLADERNGDGGRRPPGRSNHSQSRNGNRNS